MVPDPVLCLNRLFFTFLKGTEGMWREAGLGRWASNGMGCFGLSLACPWEVHSLESHSCMVTGLRKLQGRCQESRMPAMNDQQA